MSAYVLIHAKTISEAWEEAVLKTWKNGRTIPHYGKEIVCLVIIDEPFKEPRVHRGDLLVALKGTLEKYYAEVLEGTLDWAIEKGLEPYTYHQRLFKYLHPQTQNIFINQIEIMTSYFIQELQLQDFTNRHQAITWMPHQDPHINSPPCLQRVWAKPIQNKLELHTTWRSRDCFKAMHMNMLAMTMLQKKIAEKIQLQVGRYIDFSDSLHIYKNDWKEVEHFMKVVERRRISTGS
ncbi:MAG: thymidylate synthase [Candidatus Hodarchaeota archaeon]